MTNYRLQLDRLKKHYEDSVKSYSIVSFLDLAHTLRVWTEIKQGIEDSCPGLIISKGVMTKSLKKIIQNSAYVYTFLPDGITTHATATGEIGQRGVFYGPYSGSFSVSGMVKINQDGGLCVAQFLLVNRVLSDDENRKLDFESKNIPLKKISYSKYMESPAIYFKLNDSPLRNITNEELIKRVANEYEASHANAKDTGFEVKNVFSGPVRELMKYGCMELPLPYFVLLHIARTIIDNCDSKI